MMQKLSFHRLTAGLGLVALITVTALVLDGSGWLAHWGFSALTLAIVLGMAVGNTVYPQMAIHCHDGVAFSKAKLLRLGIMLYGFRLTVQQIAAVGVAAIVSDVLMLVSTFLLAWWLGRRWLKMDEDTVILIGAGSSICGAAAVMATEPLLKAHTAKVTVAVAAVVIFGTVGIFLYPQMHAWGWWPLDSNHYGVYIGSSVHEVAQVVAAGRSISPEVADTAVTTKMIRVMMLAPFLVFLAAWLKRGRHGSAGVSGSRLSASIPWFAFVFIGVALFNSLHWLPESWVRVLTWLDTVLLAMAMAALGLTTHVAAIRQAGPKPLLLGLLLLLWLVLAGGFLQYGLVFFMC